MFLCHVIAIWFDLIDPFPPWPCRLCLIAHFAPDKIKKSFAMWNTSQLHSRIPQFFQKEIDTNKKNAKICNFHNFHDIEKV